jgi:hypothetical protein
MVLFHILKPVGLPVKYKPSAEGRLAISELIEL